MGTVPFACTAWGSWSTHSAPFLSSNLCYNKAMADPVATHPTIIVAFIPDPSGTQFGITYKWDSAEFATLESAQSMLPVFGARLVNITANWGYPGAVATPQWSLKLPGDPDPHVAADIGNFIRLFGPQAIYNSALREAYGIPTPVK